MDPDDQDDLDSFTHWDTSQKSMVSYWFQTNPYLTPESVLDIVLTASSAVTGIQHGQAVIDIYPHDDGSNFSSGGDLDEFGSFADPVTAHISRLTSSVGASLNALRERLGQQLRCEMHGENFGAGVELPAFAGWVVAHRETRFFLPEIALGLVPGAGGTASLPRRIGRQRTVWLALTGRAIDAHRAFEWGLIDEISR